MFDQLDLQQFLQLAKPGNRVAVYKEFPADVLTPIGAMLAFQGKPGDRVLLESAEQDSIVGKYSLIGFDRVAELKAYGPKCHITTDHSVEVKEGCPMGVLRDLKKRYGCISAKPLPGFAGGCVGYLSYDAIRNFEQIPDRHAGSERLPEFFFQFFNGSIIFDNAKNKVSIVLVVTIDGDPAVLYEAATKRIAHMYGEMQAPFRKKELSTRGGGAWEVDLDDAAFGRVVERAKEYIRAGDVFQVVVSRSFKKAIGAEPFDVYRALRMINPAPYMFYFQSSDFTLVGASPEKLVSVQDGLMETIPIAGTRPRGCDVEEDALMERELLSDPKEEAEHMMLVDLARNDLGAVARPGTVRVEKLKGIQKFSHVMHLVSFVKALIDEKCDALDALRACFPAGTLSGAPKIRAMEIIDELESSRRGPYGGAVCFIDSAGNLDSCIAIRMATIVDGVATVRAGAGVVYDSIPHKEAEETRQKAKCVLEAIRIAEEGVL